MNGRNSAHQVGHLVLSAFLDKLHSSRGSEEHNGHPSMAKQETNLTCIHVKPTYNEGFINAKGM